MSTIPDYHSSWVFKPSVLFSSSKLREFIPTNDMSYVEKLNAMTRFIIYAAALIFLIKRDPFVLLIPICAMMVIYFLVTWGLNLKELNEQFFGETEKECTIPTINNPFMNVLPTDERMRDGACDDTVTTREKIEDAFEFNLYKDVDDVFGRENSQRQFHTMPSTTIPNKQIEFAKWLYDQPQRFKEKNLE